jgi:hypothetical protein
MRAVRMGFIVLSIFLVIRLATAAMPTSFFQAMNNMKTEDTLCVKNYDAGASVTESYTDFEHLDKETQVLSRSYISNNENDHTQSNASLEVKINSNAIGKSHLDWQSKDIIPDSFGRHATFSRSTEDLTGVFSIEKFIQLWSNSTLSSFSLDWLPCS